MNKTILLIALITYLILAGGMLTLIGNDATLKDDEGNIIDLEQNEYDITGSVFDALSYIPLVGGIFEVLGLMVTGISVLPTIATAILITLPLIMIGFLIYELANPVG